MRGMHPGIWLVIYAAIAVAPLAYMAAVGTYDMGVLRVLAISTGIVGLALALMQFVTSGRFERLSGRAGIDRTMRFHQLAARAVLVLVLVHPLLFAVPRELDALGDVPGRLMRMFTAPHLASGAIAWLLLIALIVLGLLRQRLPLRYELWRGSHALGAAIVAGASVHHALAVGTYAAEPAMALYWWVLLALALGTLAYLYFVKPFVLLQRAYRVVSNEQVGHRIRELVLEPAGGRVLRFEAGQFVWVLLDQPPLTVLDHPFSISSAPAESPRLRLLVKARGDFTSQLESLPAGARAYLDGPHGNFTLTGRRGEAIALIAGGIGIAPVIGLLRHLRDSTDRRPIGLLYGARNVSQLVHAEEIRAARAELDLEAHFFVDEPLPDWTGGIGEITGDAIRAALRADPSRCICFVCGPTPMMLDVERCLLDYGVPGAQIVYERFDYD
jgi:predicted ferric reductase